VQVVGAVTGVEDELASLELATLETAQQRLELGRAQVLEEVGRQENADGISGRGLHGGILTQPAPTHEQTDALRTAIKVATERGEPR
jgi:hypothetical protein